MTGIRFGEHYIYVGVDGHPRGHGRISHGMTESIGTDLEYNIQRTGEW